MRKKHTTVIIRASVTRRADLSTIVLCESEACSASLAGADDGRRAHVLDFMLGFVPTTWAPMLRHDGDPFATRLCYQPMMIMTVSGDGTPGITGRFVSADEYGSGEPEDVKEADVRTYLTHLAPWPAGLS